MSSPTPRACACACAKGIIEYLGEPSAEPLDRVGQGTLPDFLLIPSLCQRMLGRVLPIFRVLGFHEHAVAFVSHVVEGTPGRICDDRYACCERLHRRDAEVLFPR